MRWDTKLKTLSYHFFKDVRFFITWVPIETDEIFTFENSFDMMIFAQSQL